MGWEAWVFLVSGLVWSAVTCRNLIKIRLSYFSVSVWLPDVCSNAATAITSSDFKRNCIFVQPLGISVTLPHVPRTLKIVYFCIQIIKDIPQLLKYTDLFSRSVLQQHYGNFLKWIRKVNGLSYDMKRFVTSKNNKYIPASYRLLPD